MIPELIVSVLSAISVALAFVLMLYALHAYGILGVLFWHQKRRSKSLEPRVSEWPDVVTQIPLYNEANVAERIIMACASILYPGKHSIQVLDDSDDETRHVVEQAVEHCKNQGVSICILRREHREGYKAGALAYGMTHSMAPLIAIFDADFVPPPDFLLKAVPPLLSDPTVGFVQGRWTFLNECDSILTRAQALGLDSHFAIEQEARSLHPGLFMNFNGTAGVWRRAAMESAGGWSAETLTEDLDLSYRVQLAGWKGIYLPELCVPGELPATFAAYKSQQFRWAKGSMQTALRLLPRLWKSDQSLATKIEGFFHLTHYSVHLFLFLTVLLLPWLACVPSTSPATGFAGGLLLLASWAPTVFYGIGQARLHPHWPARLLWLPLLTLGSLGLAAANSRAILEALTGWKSPFVRTPKAGDAAAFHYRVKFPIPPLMEVGIGIYALAGAILAWHASQPGLTQFGLLTSASFLFVGLGSLRESLPVRKAELSEESPQPNIELASQ